jgi:hypothetical protein
MQSVIGDNPGGWPLKQCNLLNLLWFVSLNIMIYLTDNNALGLVDFLVTSNTRKDLLHLLWREGVEEASGHQLALLSKAT